jgi:hypothetical protein
MHNKEVSRVFQPYQAMDLLQNAKLIEKIQASTTPSDEVLDSVDSTLHFLQSFLSIKDPEQ